MGNPLGLDEYWWDNIFAHTQRWCFLRSADRALISSVAYSIFSIRRYAKIIIFHRSKHKISDTYKRIFPPGSHSSQRWPSRIMTYLGLIGLGLVICCVTSFSTKNMTNSLDFLESCLEGMAPRRSSPWNSKKTFKNQRSTIWKTDHHTVSANMCRTTGLEPFVQFIPSFRNFHKLFSSCLVLPRFLW